jgi:HK97 family phage portal protein
MATLYDRFKALLTKNQQKTNEAYNRAIYNYLGESLVWNPENDETFINKGYRYNSTVYSIVNLITKAASTIPFVVYEVQKQNDLARYKALTSGGFDASVMHKAQQIRKHSLVELDHTELHEVLKRPNPAQSYNAWLQEIIAFGKLTGNRYIFGIAPDTGINKGKYKELYVLPSQNMEIHSGGIMEPIKEYTLSYNGTYRIAADDVCHIKDFNPYYDGTGSHLYGMSPLHSGLRVLQANNEAVTTGVKYLQNQTARGVLMSEEGDLSEEQARMLKQKFKEQNQGADKAGDLVITPKKLSWINFGLTTSDLSLIEQYNASIKDLCNIYSVPVQLLNNTDASTYNNMKEAKKALYQNAVIPELIKIREELNRWLTPKYGQNLYIDFDFSVIPELQEEMDKVVQQMSNAWWITPNEKRAAMSYGADEDSAFMNDYYIPANLIPTQNLPDLIDEPETMPNASEPMDMGDDVFSTQEAAEARAAQLGGEGFHTHMTEAGETIFMPFATHEEYEAAINKGFFLTDRQIKQEYTGYPQSATNNARRMLDWIEEYGRDVVTGGTQVGLARARQLAERRPLDRETINRIYSFFSRHQGNEVIDEQYRDEPWRDNGYVAWNLWGGTSMFNYVKEIVENED